MKLTNIGYALLAVLSSVHSSQSNDFSIKSAKNVFKEFEMKRLNVVSSHGRSTLSANDLPDDSGITLRALYLLTIFSPVMLSSGLAYFSTVFRNHVWFQLIGFALSQGGAAFIKWGQWASTRPDMFPEELCDVLEHLQTKAPVHSFSFTESQILNEFGGRVEQIFEYFDKIPIASGSIAQVYRAKLNGRDVAVKVRHPNIEIQIKLDFIIMKAAASFVENYLGMNWLNLSGSLSQFSDKISAQTRLDYEGYHLHLLNKNFARWNDVSFPEPVLVSESVLVESFETGSTVGQHLKSHYRGSSKSRNQAAHVKSNREQDKMISLAHFIVTRGADTYLKMLIQDNLMHADLHPGNIILQEREEGSKQWTAIPALQESKEKPHVASLFGGGDLLQPQDENRGDGLRNVQNRIVLVDAGMVAELDEREKHNFIGLIECLGEGDGAAAAEHVLNFSAGGVASFSEAQRAGFRTDMAALFGRVCKGYHTNVNIGSVMRGILQLVRVHQITIEANYATLVMNVLCLDSMASVLFPSYNILDGAKPLLRLNRRTKSIPLISGPLKNVVVSSAQALKSSADKRFLQKHMENK